MNSIKTRLTVMSFLQFFVWGAWLITIGTYWFENKHWSGTDLGTVFSTIGIGSLLMPSLMGIVADKWLNAEKVYGILHILTGIFMLLLPGMDDPQNFILVILMAMLVYMPTIALSNSIAYSILKSKGFDVVKDFPPIRVWGTIGFIVAMWVTNLTGSKETTQQFVISGIAALILGIYSFSLPPTPPKMATGETETWLQRLGLQSFKILGNYRMGVFFIFSMLLGASLQLTNMYGDTFITQFRNLAEYANSPVVKYSTITMSISQISETLFILTIPFFFKRFGIKKVMLISMTAWVLRFLLFSYGDPGSGLWMIILSNIIYGMAFDFFNISGSLFVENETPEDMRSSAQGLFMMMTNGLGAILGSTISGWAIDKYFTLSGGDKNWHEIWMSFAIYAAVVAILFAILFQNKSKKTEAA